MVRYCELPSKTGNKAGCLLIPLLLNIMPEILTSTIRQIKKQKECGLEGNNMSFYMENSNLLGLYKATTRTNKQNSST